MIEGSDTNKFAIEGVSIFIKQNYVAPQDTLSCITKAAVLIL